MGMTSAFALNRDLGSGRATRRAPARAEGGLVARVEPWRRFQARVDPDGLLDPPERARRAKISYRAFLRSSARKAAKGRVAARHRRETSLRRRLAAGPNASEAAAFARERDDLIRSQIIWAAAQRGELGIASLARRQLIVRSDCLLCHRSFTEADREH